MTTITLQAIEAKHVALASEHAELAKMIDQLKTQAARGTTLEMPGVVLELAPGERYAGPLLNADGTVKHQLITIAVNTAGLTWEEAKAWAKSVGGELPNLQELGLSRIQALQDIRTGWFWSSEAHGESYAWICYFYYGGQSYDHRDAEGSAVAVRRF